VNGARNWSNVSPSRWAGIALIGVLAGAGCSLNNEPPIKSEGLVDTAPIPRRRSSVISDGCGFDAWQKRALESTATRAYLREVIMLCMVPRQNGDLGPADPVAQQNFQRELNYLRGLGYSPRMGVSFTDESGFSYDGGQTTAWLSDGALRAKYIEQIVARSTWGDGIELDLQQLPERARPFVVTFVTELRSAMDQAPGPRRISVLVPPSVTEPSDLPGGEAFDLRRLAPLVDQMRVMTLDFSDKTPGPTIDMGWAVDAIELARSKAPSTQLDVSYPLYGVDFGPRGLRGVSFVEARGLADRFAGGRIERAPQGPLYFRYTFENDFHTVWFDDAASTALGLRAWSYAALPADIGVTFYGFGAEDPALWSTLQTRTP
jgi:spore germination protein YaaH